MAGESFTSVMPKTSVEYDTKYFLLKELDIMGSRNALPEDFKTVIQFLESGLFPTDDVITQAFHLKRLVQPSKPGATVLRRLPKFRCR